jgi:hypothetical protein
VPDIPEGIKWFNNFLKGGKNESIHSGGINHLFNLGGASASKPIQRGRVGQENDCDIQPAGRDPGCGRPSFTAGHVCVQAVGFVLQPKYRSDLQ